MYLSGVKTMRRYYTPINGKRYLGNKNKKEVHDLDNEKYGPNQCQIDEIIASKNAVTFSPDTLTQAVNEGYDRCRWCIGGSTR
jgi:hypothetical protein